ncbi:MAG: carbon storage regulator CsrA [Pseudomonadota bacterium]
MLILSRVVGEDISIDQNITVRIIAVSGNHVRLGVEAPRYVGVHRSEVYERIKKERAEELDVTLLVTPRVQR